MLEYRNSTGASLRKTAAHFNIPSRVVISQWEKIRREEGEGALFIGRRGRPAMPDKKKERRAKKPKDEKEELLQELEWLRMENEYLKKLNALVREREKSTKKIK